MAKLEEVYARFQSYSANRMVADICTTAEAKSLLEAAAYSAATSPAAAAGGMTDGGQGALESWSTRSKVLTWRGELFQSTIARLRELDKFEEGLTRPYFHVKAMEPAELDAWLVSLHYMLILYWCCFRYQHVRIVMYGMVYVNVAPK
jgi:hypothetical protein